MNSCFTYTLTYILTSVRKFSVPKLKTEVLSHSNHIIYSDLALTSFTGLISAALRAMRFFFIVKSKTMCKR